MKKMMAALLCCLFVMLSLTGCGSPVSFTWLVDQVPDNLDPQLTFRGPDLTAVYNLYSGLVRLDEKGVPQPECAESWEISPDGLTYTFHLKEGLQYEKLKHHEKEYSLTAHDFVFGMQRVFRPETASPYTGNFSAIKNSRAVLNGELSPSQLGVSAPDERTVVYQLEKPDPKFLEKLSLPGAMPCNEEFFDHTRGAYGLHARGSASANVLANGPFRLYNWNENGLFLRRSGSGSRISSLRIVLNNTGSVEDESGPLSGADLLIEDKASAALSDDFEHPDFTSIPYTSTTWALAFNTAVPELGVETLRQALASAAYAAPLEYAPGCAKAEGLIPPSITVEGENYRSTAGSLLPAFRPAPELCKEGFAGLETAQFRNISILIPEEKDLHLQAELLNQQWQKELSAWSAFFSVREVPIEEFLRCLRTGDYQIALIPFSPMSNSAAEVLSQVQVTGTEYDPTNALWAQLEHSSDWSIAQLSGAEQQLLQQALVVPLWTQSRSLLVQPGVTGLVFRPFGPVLDLTWAEFRK